MQTFRLIQAFRDLAIGTNFRRDEDGDVFITDEDGDIVDYSSSVFQTLLDVGGYLEETTPVVWTPSVGDTVYVITGAGEVKPKEFTDSAWFRLQKNFLGYYQTRDEAQRRVELIRSAVEDILEA